MMYLNWLAFILCSFGAVYEFSRGNKAVAVVNSVFAVANGIIVFTL